MGLPITSAGGNLAVGFVTGAVATLVTDEMDEAGVNTWGQVGASLAIGVPGALITRGNLAPYLGGALAGWGVAELLNGDK